MNSLLQGLRGRADPAGVPVFASFRFRALVAPAALCWGLSCGGGASESGAPGGGGSGGSTTLGPSGGSTAAGKSGAGAASPVGSGSGGEGSAGFVELPATAPRVARLSHRQWENTVRDLLRFEEAGALVANFPVQARGGGYLFDNPAQALSVDQAQLGAYAAAAAELARSTTQEPERLAGLLRDAAFGDTGGDADRARAFVEHFGMRAFRRPLEPLEVDAYVALWQQGLTLYDDPSGFEAGVRLVLETMLQSPHFLYRVESSQIAQAGEVALSSWELAQRLSYFLTNTMPDEALFEAAASDALLDPESLRAHAERLLQTPKARVAASRFHEQLLDLEEYLELAPGRQQFPDAPSNLGQLAHDSALAFVGDLVFDRREGFRELMTSSVGFVNRDLASVYGVSGVSGLELQSVELPAAERSGILTQVGFLGANATSLNPDPIHRGVFVAERVLCRTIAAPPDNVTPPPPTGEGTNRQVVEEHTESLPGCRACHVGLINPYGFVFENYDAVGAYRTVDNGLPVDADVSVVLDGAASEVSGAVEFTRALAASREAHSCFAGHLVEYAFGRVLAEEDAGLVQSLTEASLADAPIADLMLRIAQSVAFTRRSAEELP